MDSKILIEIVEKISKVYTKQVQKKHTNNVANNSFTTTRNNNEELNNFITTYNSNRDKNTKKVKERLKADPSYTGSRSTAVKEAWRIERADLSMGGKGITKKWTEEERALILNGQTVSGVQGHHELNVADHPEEQSNPDNIGFYTFEEHLDRHNGNFRNSTNGELINKEKKLKRTNTKRNVKNELSGVADATVSNILTGFIDGSLENEGKDRSIKNTIVSGSKSALKSGGKALLDYSLTRLLKQ